MNNSNTKYGSLCGKAGLQLLIVLVLIASLFAPAGLFALRNASAARLDPALAEIAADQPDELVRVIIWKRLNNGQAEATVQSLGGRVIRDLDLIRAFSAEIPARYLARISKNSAINWVSIDAPVISTGMLESYTEYFLLDTFSQSSFSNNDGNASFASAWIENDPGGVGPGQGNATVSTDDGTLHLTGNPTSSTQTSVEREINLSDGVLKAYLSFLIQSGPQANENDKVVFEISTNGGSSYSILKTFEFDGNSGSKLIGISLNNYLTAQTRFRFRVAKGLTQPNAYFRLDDFRIDFVGNAQPQSAWADTILVDKAWQMGYTGGGIGVALIDSGLSLDADFSNIGGRKIFNPDSATPDDVYGHGTHVAGIIAGNGSDSGGTYHGVAPDISLYGLKISDENGMAYESDTVDALGWVFENRDALNIRVVNLSIQSTLEQSYHESAISVASEILWFSGVVVVAASGNYDSSSAINPIDTAPANDPYIITVGATDDNGTANYKDDVIASFSARGVTMDGYAKPEIYAPGKNIISVLSADSDWDIEYPERTIYGGQYFRISGTSMSVPMVTGAVALLLQAEPDLTPDQVKYRLITASRIIENSPYLNIYSALLTPTTESANQGVVPHMLLAKMALIAYWGSTNGGATLDWYSVNWDAVNWDAVNWIAVNWNAVNWDAVNWNAVNWNAVNWNAVNWNAVNWNAVNWNAVNWNAVNWNAVNWNAVNWNAVNWDE